MSHQDEFFPGASEWPKDLSRRSFLEMAMASLALAGFTGCTRLPTEKIIPYIKDPEDFVPGKSEFYATAFVHSGQATGILVESHQGRPTKIEGNPFHPASRGAASAQQQAFILSLYDPDRSSKVLLNGKSSSWEKCQAALQESITGLKNSKGRGFYILNEFSASPSFEDQVSQLKNAYPGVRWIQYEPVSRSSSLKASKSVFGKPLQCVYHLDRVATVVCLDADLFGSPCFPLRYAQDFIQQRRGKNTVLPELFAVEATPSITGAWTSRRLTAKYSALPEIAQELALRFAGGKSEKSFSRESENFFRQLLARKDLGPCLFIAGEHAPESVHEVCHHLNTKYAVKAIDYLTPEPTTPLDALTDLRDLTHALNSGEVESLIIIGGNPVYQSPASLKFNEAVKRAKKSFHFSLLEDETSAACQWHCPLTHPLENWSDARAFDGSLSLVQPLVEPLFAGKSPHELLALLLGKELSSYDVVQAYWRQRLGEKFETDWEKALSNGILNLQAPILAKAPKSQWKASSVQSAQPPSQDSGVSEILFRCDESIGDGRFGNNPWLQELPKPLSKLTWENAALVSPHFAETNNIVTGQYLSIETTGGTLKAPAWILPGQEENTVTLTFGYGRSLGGKIASQKGYNAYRIWDLDHPHQTTGKIRIFKDKTALASTQTHFTLNDDKIVQRTKSEKSLAVSKKPTASHYASLYTEEPLPPAPEAWAMVIDLDSCIGCSACTIACQSENNIPVVGKDGVLRGREMHWIRVDTYYSGPEHNQQVSFQPVPCMHCEKAPCELVCPVAATVHSTDGLNQMVYNRCIGTRYCSNNCPYKVRRFNFFSLNSKVSDLERLQKNPEVSVRSRGVMEKCTYCVQRIQAGRITAQKENRKIRDGEIQTACQATCPTQAIVFGDKNDVTSKVHELRQSARHYALLEELGTLPRTTYLAKIDHGGLDD